MKATFEKYTLNFKQPSGTSRGVLKTKDTYFLIIENGENKGVGECGLFKGLSIDDRFDYEEKLQWVCDHIDMDRDDLIDALKEFPSIQFGLEQALLSLHSYSMFELFPSEFLHGQGSIPINGLIWMGTLEFMQAQIKEKLAAGFTTIKMKIGAIDFQQELAILKGIRNEFSVDDIELRVDANGAFSPGEALEKLKRLSEFDLHSIEQPVKQGQIEVMTSLCEKTPLPIALDEELIGVFSYEEKKELIQTIKPQHIILKPSLVGGFGGTKDWIDLAEMNNIGWWITSALESNIGLNAIAQFTFALDVEIPQGLGTGGLFTNNFTSPLFVEKGDLKYDKTISWELQF